MTLKSLLATLPETIRVSVAKDNGVYVISLPDLDSITQADSREEIDYMINDFIYCYFDVPTKYQSKIRYFARKNTSQLLHVDTKRYGMFCSPSVLPYASL